MTNILCMFVFILIVISFVDHISFRLSFRTCTRDKDRQLKYEMAWQNLEKF